MRGGVVATVAALAAVVLAGAAPAHATGNAAAVALLNQQRAANGLPADVVADGGLAHGCALHDHYLRLNRNQFLGNAHHENPSSPGYTQEGADAASHSVLAEGPSSKWSVASNPWLTAPIHVSQLMDPALTGTGYAQREGYACMDTLHEASRPAPAAETTWAYTGPTGRVGVPTAETANEFPTTPQQEAGLAAGTTTGPTFCFYITGPWSAEPQTASITGPGATVRSYIEPRGEFGASTAAFVFARRPLQPGTTYQASVTWLVTDDTGQHPLTQTVAFTTRARKKPAGGRRSGHIGLSRRLAGHGRNRLFTVTASGPVVGQRAVIRVTGSGSLRLHLLPKERIKFPLPTGKRKVQVVVSVPAFRRHGIRYRGAVARRTYRL